MSILFAATYPERVRALILGAAALAGHRRLITRADAHLTRCSRPWSTHRVTPLGKGRLHRLVRPICATNTRNGARPHKPHDRTDPRGGATEVRSPYYVTRRAGRSTHGLRVLSIAGACRSCRRAVPSPAISRGRCAQEQTVLSLPHERIASCWSRRAFPCAALLLSYRHSPPSCHFYRVVFSRLHMGASF
jgi:pimeloyl-ACP methyl ester carboxylesterase